MLQEGIPLLPVIIDTCNGTLFEYLIMGQEYPSLLLLLYVELNSEP